MVNGYRTNKGGAYQGVPNVEFHNDLTYDKSVVMVFQLAKSTVCRIGCHKRANRPLIDRTSGSVPLEECRRGEWLQHKPPTDINTVMSG